MDSDGSFPGLSSLLIYMRSHPVVLKRALESRLGHLDVREKEVEPKRAFLVQL